MKIFISGLAILIISACNSGTFKAQGEMWEFSDAMILSVSERPAASGVLATFVEIEAKSETTTKLMLLPYFGSDQVVPEAGAVCDFEGKWDYVDGSSMKRAEFSRARKYRVIGQFTCNGETHKNDYY